jgi:hypothetical protein
MLRLWILVGRLCDRGHFHRDEAQDDGTQPPNSSSQCFLTWLVFERAHDLFAMKSLLYAALWWRPATRRRTQQGRRQNNHVDDSVVVRAPNFHREQLLSPHRGQPTHDQCRGGPLSYWQRAGFLPDLIPLEADLARDGAKAIL